MWNLIVSVPDHCLSFYFPILTIIFNRTLQTGSVPADPKRATVSAIFKKGLRYDPANYRPVSLTCLRCKMLEHTIVSSVMKHGEHHHILIDCQHGFRRRRSETQLVTLVDDGFFAGQGDPDRHGRLRYL